MGKVEKERPDAVVAEDLGELLSAPPDSLEELLIRIKPEQYLQLRTCVELGKWPDGNRLSSELLEHALQLLILYEARQLPEADRVLSNLPSGCGAGNGPAPFNTPFKPGES